MEYSLDVTSHEKASAALSVLTNAINIVSLERGRIEANEVRQANEVRFEQANTLPQGMLQLLG